MDLDPARLLGLTDAAGRARLCDECGIEPATQTWWRETTEPEHLCDACGERFPNGAQQ